MKARGNIANVRSCLKAARGKFKETMECLREPIKKLRKCLKDNKGNMKEQLKCYKFFSKSTKLASGDESLKLGMNNGGIMKSILKKFPKLAMFWKKKLNLKKRQILDIIPEKLKNLKQEVTFRATW